MVKSKRIDTFFKRKACDQMKKMHLRHLKLWNFMRIQKLKKI